MKAITILLILLPLTLLASISFAQERRLASRCERLAEGKSCDEYRAVRKKEMCRKCKCVLDCRLEFSKLSNKRQRRRRRKCLRDCRRRESQGGALARPAPCPIQVDCFRITRTCNADLVKQNMCCYDTANKVCANWDEEQCESAAAKNLQLCSIPPIPNITNDDCNGNGPCKGVCIINNCTPNEGDLLFWCQNVSCGMNPGKKQHGCFDGQKIGTNAVFAIGKDVEEAKTSTTRFEATYNTAKKQIFWDISSLVAYNVPINVETGYGTRKGCCTAVPVWDKPAVCDTSFGCSAKSIGDDNKCPEAANGVFPCHPSSNAESYCESENKDDPFQGCKSTNRGCSTTCCDVGFKTQPGQKPACDPEAVLINEPLWSSVNTVTVTFCPPSNSKKSLFASTMGKDIIRIKNFAPNVLGCSTAYCNGGVAKQFSLKVWANGKDCTNGGCVPPVEPRTISRAYELPPNQIIGLQWNIYRMKGNTCDQPCRQIKIDLDACKATLVPTVDGMCGSVETPTWTPTLSLVDCLPGLDPTLTIMAGSTVDNNANVCACSGGTAPCNCSTTSGSFPANSSCQGVCPDDSPVCPVPSTGVVGHCYCEVP